MNFDWSDFHLEFRENVRRFLAENLPANWWDMAHHGPGSHDQTHFSRAFCGKLAEAGLLIPHWPVEWGRPGPRPLVPGDPGRGDVGAPASPAAPST